MSQITHEDLERMLDKQEQNLKSHIDLRLQALPCEAHEKQIAAVEKVWPEVRELHTWKDRLLGAWAFITVAFSVSIAYLGLRNR